MRLFIPVTPMGAPRPRVTKFGAYNDPKYTNYKEAIGLIARKIVLTEKPVYMKIDFFFEIPKSWTKKKKEGAKWHTSKPDVDNLCKGVMDALNGIAYKDDTQVCYIQAQKQYAQSAGILIEIEETE